MNSYRLITREAEAGFGAAEGLQIRPLNSIFVIHCLPPVTTVFRRIAHDRARNSSAGDEAGEAADSFRRARSRLQATASRYHDTMTKQTTVRLPDDLAEQAEAVARVRGTSVNALIINSLAAEIERVREDQGFTDTARRLLERDKELLERLAR